MLKSSETFDSLNNLLANQFYSVKKFSIKKPAIPCTLDIPYFYNNPPANPPKPLYHADKYTMLIRNSDFRRSMTKIRTSLNC